MSILSFSREKIETGLKDAISKENHEQRDSRVLFSPKKICNENFSSVCAAFSKADPGYFRSVVMIESTPEAAEKKLAMPSFKKLENHFGKVKANVKLRNDFADEDDDFFIDDDAFHDDSCLYQLLPILQCLLDDFTVLHIQVTDEKLPIIKELAMALQEILPSRHSLLICCSDMGKREEISHVQNMVENDNLSGVMNYINKKDPCIQMDSSFITGLLVAKKWGLNLNFEYDEEEQIAECGYAVMQNQPIFG